MGQLIETRPEETDKVQQTTRTQDSLEKLLHTCARALKQLVVQQELFLSSVIRGWFFPNMVQVALSMKPR